MIEVHTRVSEQYRPQDQLAMAPGTDLFTDHASGASGIHIKNPVLKIGATRLGPSSSSKALASDR